MRRELGIGLLLLAASSVLIWNCWNAEFLGYDDAAHIHLVPQIFGQGSWLDVFKPPREFVYFPVSVVSYRIDYVLFGQWMEKVSWLPDWAFAVRMMNCVYHAAAAYFLLRFLEAIGVKRAQALFVAFAFVLHPMACETVCWPSERKNVLAGMFGFAALWAFVAGEGRRWRLPATTVLYLLANGSKPSALGFLPVFGLMEVFGGRAGLNGERLPTLRPLKHWAFVAISFIPLIAVSFLILFMNWAGTATVRIPPLGGSVFTAGLTDVEIFARYVKALIAPFDLSFAYYIQPITSLLDARLCLYGTLLATLIALTVWLAENRRRALFGWLWAVAVLTPSFNFVAISHAMQDRYFYLSAPGVLLALTEAVVGMCNRAAVKPGALRIPASVFLLGLAVLSFSRGGDYRNTLLLFSDAVEKQPLAASSHFGVMFGYINAAEKLQFTMAPGPEVNAKIADLKRAAENERLQFFKCPDVKRHAHYTEAAVEQGQDDFRRGKLDSAEHFLQLAAHPEPGIIILPKIRSAALRDLAVMRLSQKNPAEALPMLDEAVAIGEERDVTLFVRAQAKLQLAALKLTSGEAVTAQNLTAAARDDLGSVPRESRVFEQAQNLLKQSGPTDSPLKTPRLTP